LQSTTIRRQMSVLILAEGDYHCGNLLGLVPPSEQTGKLKHIQKIVIVVK
jgi:hypothetical protein